jgi:uncharacterized protein YndB with AHSA1/START domain
MSKPSFVYVTYIQTTPEKLWNALLDPELTKDYWARHANRSDWKPGSPWRHEDYDDASQVRIVGTVLESVPPRRLVLTWASPENAGDPVKTSRVTFDVEPYRDAVRLTVIHDELEPESEMLRGISAGWPAVLSSLKSMLETGEPLPWMRRNWKRPAQAEGRARSRR